MRDVSEVVTDVAEFTQELINYTVEEVLMFEVFKKTFNKTYPSSSQEKTSLLNFLSNQRDIKTHNKKYAAGIVTFSVSLNAYSDMPPEEVSKRLNGFILPVTTRALKDEKFSFVPPESLNWVTKGFVTKGS